VLGVNAQATGWLITPNPILDWDVPLVVARASEDECQLVCDVLNVLRGLGKWRVRDGVVLVSPKRLSSPGTIICKVAR
jgi:hypothetical protein